MKKAGILQLTFVLGLMYLLPNLVNAQQLDKSYQNVEFLEISTKTGDITVERSNSNEVMVKGEWDEDLIKVKVNYDGKTLIIKEKAVRKNGNVNGNASTWSLLVPDGIELKTNSGTGSLFLAAVEADLDANSGTGNITIEDMEGRFDVNSGTGNIEVSQSKGRFDLNSGTGYVKVENTEGKFDANSGTGNVKFEMVNPTGNSSLNSGTGNVKFIVANKISADLSLNSGTGNAILDFHGNTIEGDFEMSCGMPSGRIAAPFKFDLERKIGGKHGGSLEKTARIGKANYDVEISTGTGLAEVKS